MTVLQLTASEAFRTARARRSLRSTPTPRPSGSSTTRWRRWPGAPMGPLLANSHANQLAESNAVKRVESHAYQEAGSCDDVPEGGYIDAIASGPGQDDDDDNGADRKDRYDNDDAPDKEGYDGDDPPNGRPNGWHTGQVRFHDTLPDGDGRSDAPPQRPAGANDGILPDVTHPTPAPPPVIGSSRHARKQAARRARDRNDFDTWAMDGFDRLRLQILARSAVAFPGGFARDAWDTLPDEGGPPNGRPTVPPNYQSTPPDPHYTTHNAPPGHPTPLTHLHECRYNHGLLLPPLWRPLQRRPLPPLLLIAPRSPSLQSDPARGVGNLLGSGSSATLPSNYHHDSTSSTDPG